ncbi:MAG: biopolymer transporter ExbD [Spirochaetales bacterium]|nr:biopolymer transporter ExbD [Spirochaetales bacterium]
MNLTKKARRKPIIPINSMSDIAFLLLIFIMLISLINYRKEIKIEYPEAVMQESVNADANLELWITRDGDIFHEGALITARTAEGIIAGEIAENPSLRIHILADRHTPYRHINTIMETLQILQHRVVSLVVKENV